MKLPSPTLLLAAALLAAGAGPFSPLAPVVWAQQIVLEPADTVLAGEPLAIRFTGLPAGAEVQVATRRVVREFTGAQRPYAAQARYRTSASGALDLASAAPLPGGSYSGADLRGLFWSMQPVPAAAVAGGESLADGQVQIELRAVDAGGQPGASLATRTLSFLRALPEVVSRPADGFPGALFSSLPGSKPRPALIILGGSEGGRLITRDAPVYASRGFAVLALPYYSPAQWGPSGPMPAEVPELPRAFADIPVERLAAARDWLAKQPGVDAQRIGVVGTSKGAEYALLAASRMPWIRSVLAIVPSDVVWEGWGEGVKPGERSSFAWQGQPLPFVPYKDFEKEFAGFATGADVKIRRPQDAGRAANPERVAPARIRVEDIAAPVMVVGGHDDQIWDSGGMAENIARSRAAAGRETVALVYREAGHFLGGTGWAPTTQYNAGPSKSGGTPEANARAQAEAWTKSFEFLRRTLGPMP
jgi:dienelactone hydrolase